MIDRTCLWCGVSIEHKAIRVKYCSRTHAANAASAGNLHKKRLLKVPRPCPVCGMEFVPIRGGEFCSGRCRSTKYRRENPFPRRPARSCPCDWCGAVFITTHPFKKFCQVACRKRSILSKKPTYRPRYPVERDLLGKNCCDCGEYKLYDEYQKRNSSSDSLFAKCVDCRRIDRWMQKYGLSRAEASEFLMVKDCEICGRVVSAFAGNLHVDHCHKTGKVRGALCFACNTGLGGFRDEPSLLHNAAEYLLRHTDVVNMPSRIEVEVSDAG